MPSVFLSYSRTDWPFVEQLAALLEQTPDISVWYDQERIYGGQKWPKILGEAIADHDLFLLAWSKTAAKSHFVEFEWTTAIALKKVVIPCVLDGTPLPPALRASHAIDIHKSDGGANSILQALKSHLPTHNRLRAGAVINELATIQARDEATVIKEVLSIFEAHHWTIQDNADQAGGYTHNHQTSPMAGDKKSLVEKLGLWVSLCTGVLSIITAGLPYLTTFTKPPEDSKLKAIELTRDDSRRDPFDRGQTKANTKENYSDGLETLQKRIHSDIGPDQKLTILIMMTAGGTDQKESIARIEDRDAVEAALDVACFSEDPAKLLNYFTWKFAKWNYDDKASTITTPYQWYDRREDSPCRGSTKADNQVLILWIKAGDYQGQVLAGINQLLAQVTPRSHREWTAKIIGPRTSVEFRTILNEIERNVMNSRISNKFSWLQKHSVVELYSPWATTMPGLLSYGLKDQDEQTCRSYAKCDEVFNQLLKENGLALRYSIDSDVVVFDVLLEELTRRGIKVGTDSIALVGEWESYYSKNLFTMFSAAACSNVTRGAGPRYINIEEAVDQVRANDSCSMGLEITKYTYTTSYLEHQKADIVARIKFGKPRAIGILGADPSVTLSILQDLKKEFPHVLFFTTVLDFNYLNNSEQKRTRNLLVASQFGLQLHSSLQQNIPPFYNSLQTSTYLSVLRAMDRISPEIVSGAASPRLFEIGRYGAVDLSVDGPRTGEKTIHPIRADVAKNRVTADVLPRIKTLWITLLVVSFLSIWKSRRMWTWITAGDMPDPSRGRLTIVLRSALIVFPVLWAFWSLNIEHFNYAEDEPFSWSDGVSIWPTEFLRLFTIALGVLFLFMHRMELRDNVHQLTEKFFPAERISPAKNKQQSTGLGEFWQTIDWIGHGLPRGENLGAADLWKRYSGAQRWNHHIGRILLVYCVYVAAILPLSLFLSPDLRSFAPCRGSLSCSMDRFIEGWSQVILVFLLFSVLDSLWLCISWVNDLSGTSGLSAKSAISLLAERTRVVKHTVYYPLIIGIMLYGARSQYFDNWHSSPLYFAFLSIFGLIILLSRFSLHTAEAKARSELIGGQRRKGIQTTQRLRSH